MYRFSVSSISEQGTHASLKTNFHACALQINRVRHPPSIFTYLFPFRITLTDMEEDTTQARKRLLIVGGGAAGLLTAMKAGPAQDELGLEITLIDCKVHMHCVDWFSLNSNNNDINVFRTFLNIRQP